MSVSVRTRDRIRQTLPGLALPGAVVVAALVLLGSCKAELINAGLLPANPPVGTPQVFIALSGDSQSGPVGTTLAQPVSVRVYDSLGNGFPNIPVVWAATRGGQLTPAQDTTDVNGSVSALWTLGDTAGVQSATATSPGLGSVTFTSFASATLQQIFLQPSVVNLQTGGSQQFSVSSLFSDGAVGVPTVTYAATGGTVTAAGLYTAGGTPGVFQVIATEAGGLADTATVSISSPAAALVRIDLTPSTTSLSSGATQQFAVSGKMSDSSTIIPTVTYAATGGTISSGGFYTAGATAGTFRVIATQTGGTLADTSTVTIIPPTLTRVILTPATVTLAAGALQQFSVSGQLSNGGTTTVSANFTATGGTITSGGVYTAGISSGVFQVIAADKVTGLADTSAVTVTALPTLQAVELTPSSANVLTGFSQQFSAIGRLSSGGTTPVTVTYSATGGTITVTGLYTAGNTPGSFQAIATEISGLADTAVVTVTQAPPPGVYTTVAAQNWNNYASDAALKSAGIFGVEGGLNTQAPALPTTAFYELASDSLNVFGKVVRYIGDPSLNTTSTTLPGRITIHTARFAPVTNVWVRQYRRFSPNWTTAGANPSGGSSYKTMFFRWENAGFRMGHLINGGRERVMELGQGTSGGRPGDVTYNTGVATPPDCPFSLDFGRPFNDMAPQIAVGSYLCAAGQTIPAGPGDGQWYEIIMHYKIAGTFGVAKSFEGTVATFRVTTGGVLRPAGDRTNVANWKIISLGVTQTTDLAARAKEYDMGVNRNKQWDSQMSVFWGPYDVVDGSLFPDPFQVGSVWPNGGGL